MYSFVMPLSNDVIPSKDEGSRLLFQHNYKLVLLLAAFSPLFVSSAKCDTNSLFNAANFALTGSDNVGIEVVDLKKCIFRSLADGGVFYLNNVTTSRTTIKREIDRTPYYVSTYYIVDFRGDDIVYARTDHPKKTETPLDNVLLRENPHFYDTQRIEDKEWSVVLHTDEEKRLVRAWKYIYEHGCTGKIDSF